MKRNDTVAPSRHLNINRTAYEKSAIFSSVTFEIQQLLLPPSHRTTVKRIWLLGLPTQYQDKLQTAPSSTLNYTQPKFLRYLRKYLVYPSLLHGYLNTQGHSRKNLFHLVHILSNKLYKMIQVPKISRTFVVLLLLVRLQSSSSVPVSIIEETSVGDQQNHEGKQIPSPSLSPFKCLTLEERHSLVVSCRRKSREWKLYEHVCFCFGHELKRLASESSDKVQSSTLNCIEESLIIDALINCAIKVDPGDVPARDSLCDGSDPAILKPAVRTATITIGLTGYSFGAPIKMDVNPAERKVLYSTRDLQVGAKWNMCEKSFMCCLIDGETTATAHTCLEERCVHNKGC